MKSSKDFVRARSERGGVLVSSASIFVIADAFFEAISAVSSAAFKRGDASVTARSEMAMATYCDYEVDALCHSSINTHKPSRVRDPTSH
jgi:hypothetical protein